MTTVNQHLAVAAMFIDRALAATTAISDICLRDANRRMDLIHSLQDDLAEMARRTEYDLVKLIKKAGDQQ